MGSAEERLIFLPCGKGCRSSETSNQCRRVTRHGRMPTGSTLSSFDIVSLSVTIGSHLCLPLFLPGLPVPGSTCKCLLRGGCSMQMESPRWQVSIATEVAGVRTWWACWGLGAPCTGLTSVSRGRAAGK